MTDPTPEDDRLVLDPESAGLMMTALRATRDIITAQRTADEQRAVRHRAVYDLKKRLGSGVSTRQVMLALLRGMRDRFGFSDDDLKDRGLGLDSVRRMVEKEPAQ